MKYTKILLFSTTLVSLVAFTGCATQEEIMIQEGYPQAYAKGFDDGCHSGKKAGGSLFDQFKKDVNRFGKHGKYTQGWSDGFRQCEKEEEAMERQIRMSMEQQRLNEERKRNDKMDKYYLESEALRGVNYDAKLLNRLK
jgi:flagellar biosynthesis/type III secretory pathway protein FliH